MRPLPFRFLFSSYPFAFSSPSISQLLHSFADKSRSVLLLVDELIKYEDKTGFSADYCLSQLCKLLDFYTTGPRTYMIATSLREIREASASNRLLHWAKLNLLGHGPGNLVDYSRVDELFDCYALLDTHKPIIRRYVHALNGHARPLTALAEELQNPEFSLLSGDQGIAEAILKVFPYDFKSLGASEFNGLLISLFGGRPFSSTDTFGTAQPGAAQVTAGYLQQHMYILDSVTSQGNTHCILSPSFIASFKKYDGGGDAGIKSYLLALMESVSRCAYWANFETVVFDFVSVRASIHGLECSAPHRCLSAAFRESDVNIVDFYSHGYEDSVLVPPHTLSAKSFIVSRKKKVMRVHLDQGKDFSVDDLRMCTDLDTTYVIGFKKMNQQGIDMVVATSTTWYGIQVAYTKPSRNTKPSKTYLDARKIVPALHWYEKIKCPTRERGPLVFITNRPFARTHYDINKCIVNAEFSKFSSVFVVNYQMNKKTAAVRLFDKLLTPSFCLPNIGEGKQEEQEEGDDDDDDEYDDDE